jgi:PKD repeat protein
MGWSARDVTIAKNVEFNSNDIRGAQFGLQSTDQAHSYKVSWTLNLAVQNKNGKAVGNKEIIILDKNNKKVMEAKTDDHGRLSTELLEYSVDGKEKSYASPYTIVLDDTKKQVTLNCNSSVTMVTSLN